MMTFIEWIRPPAPSLKLQMARWTIRSLYRTTEAMSPTRPLPRNRKCGSSFAAGPQVSTNTSMLLHLVRNYCRAHSIISVRPRHFKLKASVMPFRELSPIAIQPWLHGKPSLGMEPTPITVGVHGWFSTGESLAFFPECECSCLVHVRVFDI